MSYEVIQRVGKYQYIFLATGYRNKDGKVRQKRVPIGKVDPTTGRKIYKPEYLAQSREDESGNGSLPDNETSFSMEDVRLSTVRSCGLFHLLRGIADQIGLTAAMKSAFSEDWMRLFMLCCYMIASGDPLMYCEDWLRSTESYPVGRMTSQQISRLLLRIRPEQRDAFFRAWHSSIGADEYLALDITSHSSYSELIEDVEWGYNRDREKLPQVNVCLLMGQTTRLPIYQTEYSGSLKDVSTLECTLRQLEAIIGTSHITAVLDKGFYSSRNVSYLLGKENQAPTPFLLAVPFTTAFARHQVAGERKDIDCVENTILVNGDSLRAVTKERAWGNGKTVFTHIYYNASKAHAIREDLYAKIAWLREKIDKDPESAQSDKACAKYLIVRKSEKKPLGYTVNIRKDVIEKELEVAGWLVLISSTVRDAKEALSVYRDKDVVEKGFLRLKNSIDLGRLRIHSGEAMQNKLLIGFFASVLMSRMNQVMGAQGLYKTYTMKEMQKILDRQRIHEIRGQKIFTPPTCEQKNFYAAFGMAPPS